MAVKEKNIARLSDFNVAVTVKEGGAAADLSSGYDNLVVFVYHADRTIIGKFSDQAASGYEFLDTTNANIGVLSFVVTSAMTTLAPLGKYYYEVLVRKADGTLADSEYDRISTGNYLFTMVDSLSSSETLP